MELQESFDKAVSHSRELAERPSNEELLKLYALYKQATEGDVTGDRPGGFDFKGIAKYDAWAMLKGTPKDEAKKEYILFVESLHQKS
ncbi:acyl-CoA-binding protein [Roseivirga sp. BDSF3-8]|uniref:acyl-CoA-binding protein n=1 Tax=Roseivirga sp. BDSF3-8 TaxID=3241598 RepID=UPI003531C008